MNDEDAREAALAHFGVKGMHWGVRKNNQSTPTGKQIHAARNRHEARIHKLGVDYDRVVAAKTDAQRRKIVAEIHKVAREGLESGDASVGARLTRGEKISTLILSGGLGTLALSQQKKRAAHVETMLFNRAATIKPSEFPRAKK